MPTPTDTFDTGDDLYGSVVSDLAAVRAYLLGNLVDTDFDDEALPSEQLYRPDIYAVPEFWFDGSFFQLRGRTAGQDPAPIPRPGTTASTGRGFGAVRDRYSTFPQYALLQGDWCPIKGLCIRHVVEEPGALAITAQWFSHTVQNGTDDPIDFGEFALRYRRVEDGLTTMPTEITATKRPILHPEERHQFSLIGVLDVDEDHLGTYDIGVCYKRGTLVSDEAFQIATMQRHLGLEVLRRG